LAHPCHANGTRLTNGESSACLPASALQLLPAVRQRSRMSGEDLCRDDLGNFRQCNCLHDSLGAYVLISFISKTMGYRLPQM
jgi:hypothetical protein